MMTPEGYVKADVDKYLKAIGAYVIKPGSFGFGASGAPDRACCIKGKFVGIEVKREGGFPTALQKLRMNEIKKAGGVAVWGDSFEMIHEALKTTLGLSE